MRLRHAAAGATVIPHAVPLHLVPSSFVRSRPADGAVPVGSTAPAETTNLKASSTLISSARTRAGGRIKRKPDGGTEKVVGTNTVRHGSPTTWERIGVRSFVTNPTAQDPSVG